MKIGDIVELKSGGCIMTVEEVRGSQVHCCWLTQHEGAWAKRTAMFPIECLVVETTGGITVPPVVGNVTDWGRAAGT